MKNKKLFGILLGLCIVSASLAGCSTENDDPNSDMAYNENQENQKNQGEDAQQNVPSGDDDASEQKPADTQKPTDTQKPADTQKPTETQKPESTQQPSNTNPQNVFYDPNAAQYHMNNVHMQPGRVYWENGTLVAEYVITNGFTDRSVGNINVKEIVINNANGKIAAASFGVLQNAVIGPRGYITWKFYFGADCISQQNADLSYLKCTYNLTYNY